MRIKHRTLGVLILEAKARETVVTKRVVPPIMISIIPMMKMGMGKWGFTVLGYPKYMTLMNAVLLRSNIPLALLASCLSFVEHSSKLKREVPP